MFDSRLEMQFAFLLPVFTYQYHSHSKYRTLKYTRSIIKFYCHMIFFDVEITLEINEELITKDLEA